MRLGIFLSFLCVSVVLLGCATVAPDKPLATSFILDQPDCGIPGRAVAAADLQSDYADLIAGGQRNAVLNFERLGLKAYRLHDYCVARAAFDEAVRVVGGIIADDAAAKRARSLFGRESSKIFKGEPYERSMLYFYRGLLYYQAGEHDNARACFRSGQLADAYAEEEAARADYAILDYLEGKTDQKYGEDAEDPFRRAQEDAAGGRFVPSTDPANDLLVIVESGSGPVKSGGGEYDEKLFFSRGQRGGDRVVLYVDGEPVTEAPRPTEDVYYQATTRGGREIDHVLAGKAQFKDVADTAGNVMIVGGAALAASGQHRRDKDLTYTGAGIALGGLLAKGLAAGTKPEADVRRWDTLPDRLHVFSVRVGPGAHDIRAEVYAGGEKIAEAVQRGVTISDEGVERLILLPAVSPEKF